MLINGLTYGYYKDLVYKFLLYPEAWQVYIFGKDMEALKILADIAIEIGNRLGIDEIKAEMLPTDKYRYYEEIRNDDITIFVGDGINDAPVLKRADIGISMGNLGSDIAIDASDIVIMNDDLNKIPRAIDISKYVRKIIKQNLIFAISVKILVLILSTFGLVNMWLAVFADTGLTLLTILNSLRILKKFK